MKVNELIERLKDTIHSFELLKKGDRVLVAVSGGPDSVALFYGLLALKSDMHKSEEGIFKSPLPLRRSSR